MAAQHLDQLTAVDAGLLDREGANTHMHVGGVALFDGPAPPLGELLDHVRARLGLVPRYRQKLAFPPLGRPRWVDDPTFNLEYHVRHTALPPPGDHLRLRRLAARIFSQRLDRTKPLWELWFVEGLEGGRYALVSKTHQALVDGVDGVDLMTMLFDAGPEPADAPRPDRWQPRPAPSGAQLAAVGLEETARQAVELPFRALGAAGRPDRALGAAREALRVVARGAWATLNPPPETPLDVDVGPHRLVAFVPASLDGFRNVKNAFGCTVNDVVLAVIAGALRRWLHNRGVRTEGLELRAGVPVSVRRAGGGGSYGGGLRPVVCPLPVSVVDPVGRLRWVGQHMADVNESGETLGAEAIANLADFAPPTILAQASRLNFSTRFYDVPVTNVPGPQFPLYVLGRRLEATFPIPFVAADRALAVAIMSYCGAMNFGLIADYDAVGDLDVLADGITASLDELVGAAGGTHRRPRSRTRSRARGRRSRPPEG